MGEKPHSQSKFRGGGGTCCIPSGSATDTNLWKFEQNQEMIKEVTGF